MKGSTKKATGLAAAFAALLAAGGLDFLPPGTTGALGQFIQRNPLTTGAVVGLVALIAVIINFKRDEALREEVTHLTHRVVDLEEGPDTTTLDNDPNGDDQT